MKKNKFSVLILVLSFVFVGCDNGGGGNEPYTGPKTIKITGINVSFSEATVLLVGDGINRSSIVAEGTGSISNGSITVVMKNQDQTDWTGTGSYILVLEDPSGINGTFAYTDGGTIPLPQAKVSITRDSTTFSFNKFTKIRPLGG
ncbi:MAG: hypothetical protein LBC53_06280 [Spirochaetaceae bacterium]|jgi:hypothetical protein|nr:hypothetical protein [Spirochaetaceae bacterium]